MNPQRRSEIRRIVDHFRGKEYHEKLMGEFCRLQKIEPLTKNDLQDYTFQADYDDKLVRIVPTLTQLLSRTQYVPTFASVSEIGKLEKANEDIHVRICQLFEQEAIPFTMLDKIGGQIASLVTQYIEQAGNAVYNKAFFQVVLPVLRERFGTDFTSKHAADYVRERLEKKSEKR